jgi:hypothetical protein
MSLTRSLIKRSLYRVVEQLAAHRVHIPKITGSSPVYAITHISQYLKYLHRDYCDRVNYQNYRRHIA